MMFSANTGMNLSQIISLPWTGEYETEKQKQGFKQSNIELITVK